MHEVADGIKMKVNNGSGDRTLALVAISKVPFTSRGLLRTGLPSIVKPYKKCF